MEGRVEAAGLVVPGLAVGHLVVDQAELAERRAEDHLVDAALGHARGVAQVPGGAQQTALPGIGAGHGHAGGLGVLRRLVAEGAGPRADAARADAVGLVAKERPARRDDVGQGLQRLGHRAVVGGVDDGAGAVADEVERRGGRRLAVQLGEVDEVAAADPGPGEGLAGGGEEIVELLGVRKDAARHDEAEVAGRGDRDRGRGQARRLCPAGHLGELLFGRAFAGNDDFQRRLGAQALGQSLEGAQGLLGAVLPHIQVEAEEAGASGVRLSSLSSAAAACRASTAIPKRGTRPWLPPSETVTASPAAPVVTAGAEPSKARVTDWVRVSPAGRV